jgi:glycosyltransferase involved in cell wall biosynthesis
MNVLYIYKWGTMGGVERVILNRVTCLKQQNADVKTFVYFLEDFGGVKKMNEYILNYNLKDHLEIVKDLKPEKYDLIISIDTPEIFEQLKNFPLIVECHTIYENNRQYLKSLPKNISKIVLPSNLFFKSVKKEIPDKVDKLFVLPNFIPSPEKSIETNKLIFNKIPILYTGRLDQQKNALEIVEIVSRAKQKFGDRLILIYAGSIQFPIESFQYFMESHNMSGRVIFIPHIGFHKMNNLLQLIKNHKGIFVSASTGETFGMSVAEAMALDIPVLLSEIKAHKSLVNNDQSFLYPLYNIDIGAKKLIRLVNSWDEKSSKIKLYKESFNESIFIKAWDILIGEVQKTNI